MASLLKKENYKTLTGPDKAAILLLALGEEHAAKLFDIMDEDEIPGAQPGDVQPRNRGLRRHRAPVRRIYRPGLGDRLGRRLD